jgi:hypothetical protein
MDGNAMPENGPPALPVYPDHLDLMVVRSQEGNSTPVASPADWRVRRAHILAHFQTVSGPMPGGERRVPLDVRVDETFQEAGYRRMRISYASEPGDRVPAWLLLPDGGEVRRPAMLCLHQTTAIGKDEPVGLGGKPNLRYASELAERGFVCLAPDYPIFGERKLDAYAIGYASTTMKGIWDHMRAVDLLAERAEVDPARIGVIGHSLGGHNSIFVAMFDERIKAVVSSCGFNSFRQYAGGNLAGWSHAGYMPRLRSRHGADPGRVPFDFPELVACLAPRAFFTNSPTGDDNFPVEGVRVCIEAAGGVYKLLGVPGKLVAEYPEAGHDFPAENRERAYGFLEKNLV